MDRVRHIISNMDDLAKNSMEAIAAVHGGLLKHTSINGLMEKVGGVVDEAALQNLFEQLAIQHAALYNTKNQ